MQGNAEAKKKKSRHAGVKLRASLNLCKFQQVAARSVLRGKEKVRSFLSICINQPSLDLGVTRCYSSLEEVYFFVFLSTMTVEPGTCRLRKGLTRVIIYWQRARESTDLV